MIPARRRRWSIVRHDFAPVVYALAGATAWAVLILSALFVATYLMGCVVKREVVPNGMHVHESDTDTVSGPRVSTAHAVTGAAHPTPRSEFVHRVHYTMPATVWHDVLPGFHHACPFVAIEAVAQAHGWTGVDLAVSPEHDSALACVADRIDAARNAPPQPPPGAPMGPTLIELMETWMR